MDQYLTEAVAADKSKKAHCVVDFLHWASISQRLRLLAKLRKHIVLLMLCSGPVSHRGCGCWLVLGSTSCC